MSKLNKRSSLTVGNIISTRYRFFPAISAVLVAAGITLSGCATAMDKDDKGSAPKYPPADVPTFSGEVGKSLLFSNKRVALVFAVDEAGNVQVFRDAATKAFITGDLALHPLKADSIASFKSFAIIKTTNPKICWPTSDGTAKCIEY